LNDEATLMVSDRALGQQMEQVFMEDLGYAREITLDAFRRRSWFQRIAERGANFFTRLL
jgi:phosphatidylserine/phosphatidylglycerophosphate/cardiolipin synthase-like enzyme